MKRALGLVLKFTVTAAIFVAIFLEFGGGWMPVETAQLTAPDTFAVSNPAFPGLVGRLRARLTGAPLPPPRLPSTAGEVCAGSSLRAGRLSRGAARAKRD